MFLIFTIAQCSWTIRALFRGSSAWANPSQNHRSTERGDRKDLQVAWRSAMRSKPAFTAE